MSRASPSAGTWLEVFSRYQRYVSILKWIYVAVAMVVDLPRRLVLHRTFVHFSLNAGYVATVVAVLGRTITTYCSFWQSSQEAEDQRVDPTAHALIDAPGAGIGGESRGCASTPILGWATRT